MSSMTAKAIFVMAVLMRGSLSQATRDHALRLVAHRSEIGGENLGTARSVHAATNASAFFGALNAPWDTEGCHQIFALSGVSGSSAAPSYLKSAG
jgi:hypothetical protein